MKTLKILLIAICMFGYGTSKAQDPATMAALSSAAKAGIIYSINNWDKISWLFTGMHHTWWYCRYQDGFTTYNNFRSYRTSRDAYTYFVLGYGDCDAVYDDQYGNERPICYETPWQAKRYTDQHGPIVDMGFQLKGGGYRSLLQY